MGPLDRNNRTQYNGVVRALKLTAKDCEGNACDEIAKEYKFYFLGENSFCNDYATEKFLARIENHVVVTFGLFNRFSILALTRRFRHLLAQKRPPALASSDSGALFG